VGPALLIPLGLDQGAAIDRVAADRRRGNCSSLGTVVVIYMDSEATDVPLELLVTRVPQLAAS